MSVASDDSGESSSGDESLGGVQGFTIPMELAIGGSPVPGVVLGAGSWPVHVPSAQYEFGRGDYAKTESASYGSIAMLGPFIDVYPAAIVSYIDVGAVPAVPNYFYAVRAESCSGLDGP